jgi:hypothetical protein
MNYNNPNRQITIGVSQTLNFPDDASRVTQLLANGRPEIKVVETYRVFRIPSERDECVKYLHGYGKVVYQGDTVINVRTEKHLEDELLHYLVDLYHQALAKKDVLLADQIMDKLRAMGVVLMPRKGSDLFWNVSGLIQTK